LLVEIFHKPHALYFPSFRYLSTKTMSVGMGLETRVHCLYGVFFVKHVL
jgi:hypothetical protein